MGEKATKSMQEWEKERNLMFTQGYVANKQLTAEEVDEFFASQRTVGVDFEGRTAWLKENGYDITRENMMNANLAPLPPKD